MPNYKKQEICLLQYCDDMCKIRENQSKPLINTNLPKLTKEHQRDFIDLFLARFQPFMSRPQKWPAPPCEAANMEPPHPASGFWRLQELQHSLG